MSPEVIHGNGAILNARSLSSMLLDVLPLVLYTHASKRTGTKNMYHEPNDRNVGSRNGELLSRLTGL